MPMELPELLVSIRSRMTKIGGIKNSGDFISSYPVLLDIRADMESCLSNTTDKDDADYLRGGLNILNKLIDALEQRYKVVYH